MMGIAACRADGHKTGHKALSYNQFASHFSARYLQLQIPRGVAQASFFLPGAEGQEGPSGLSGNQKVSVP